MPGPNVGDAEIRVTFDGSGLPAQARALGEKGGAEAGDGFNTNFEKSTAKLGDGVKEKIEKIDNSIKKASGSTDKLTKSIKKNDDANKKWFKSLSRNTRFWIVAIAAIASVAGEIAVLGSVIGSSLAVMGAGVVAFGLAAAVGVAIFKDLNKEIKDLPVGPIRDAAKAFQDFQKALSKSQDQLANAAGKDVAAGFKSLKDTLLGLQPALNALAAGVGAFFAAFAASIAPGTQGFENWNRLIIGAAPVLKLFGDAVIALGTALGTIFVAALPSLIHFGQFLDTIFSQFSTWLASAEGQNALTDFFATLETVAPHLGNLIAALGQALAALVTPETIKLTTDFIDNLADFLPVLGGLLGALAPINTVGIVVQVLKSLGEVIEPLLPFITEFARVIGEALIDALVQVTPSLVTIAEVLAEFLVSITPLLGPLLQLSLLIIGPVVGALQTLAWLLELISPVLVTVGNILSAFGQSIVALFSLDFAAIGQLWANVWASLTPETQAWITQTIGMFVDFFNNTIGMFVDFFNNTVGMFVDFFNNTIGMLVDWFNNTIGMFSDFFSNTWGMFSDFFGMVAGAWNSFWGAFPKVVHDIWHNIGEFIEDGINNAIGLLNKLFDGLRSLASVAGIKIPKIPNVNLAFASGTIATSATYGVFGEAGPEAIVPLDRPLSQVDPSVRGLSAFAQGKTDTTSGNAPQKIITVAPGAIVVQTIGNPFLAANAVLDRLVTKL